MSFLSFLLGQKKTSASVAKERLQIILAHERTGDSNDTPDYLPQLQQELVAVISHGVPETISGIIYVPPYLADRRVHSLLTS